MPELKDKTLFSEKTVSVSEVNATIKACIDSPIFKSIEVFGEISGYKFSGAHAYFTLKDKNSQLPCVCFNARKTYVPKDGESVIIFGSLDYWEKGGRLSLQASEIKPVGQGLLFLEFERLKAKLTDEGLFDQKYKKPIPTYSKNILVVTSKTGAVIRDIVTTIRRKNPVVNITVKDVRVQGDGAGKDIASVLDRVDLLGYDVIILARGGGSLEDLAPFYDESLVRAIFKMKTPIVSAIGHETDFSLADFVADMRAPTPTAAGELVAFDYYGMVEQIQNFTTYLKKNVLRHFEKCAMKVNLSTSKLSHAINVSYAQRARRVENALTNIKNQITKKTDFSEYKLNNAIESLNNLNPTRVLKRGYFKIQSGTSPITKVSLLKVGEVVNAVGGDGNFDAQIIKVNLDKETKNEK